MSLANFDLALSKYCHIYKNSEYQFFTSLCSVAKLSSEQDYASNSIFIIESSMNHLNWPYRSKLNPQNHSIKHRNSLATIPLL